MLLHLIIAMQTAGAAPERAIGPTLRKPISAGAIITLDHLSSDDASVQNWIGKASRRFLPAGSTISEHDLMSPKLVLRNQPVKAEFTNGQLTIAVEGRALSDGAIGDTVRVLNLSSKSVVLGVVVGRNRVQVH